jgi:transcriptional regulator with XRE-family HTH domain
MKRSHRRRYDWRACGHRLRVTRIALGITEQAAADAHGVTLATYRKYEAGYPQRPKLAGGFVGFANAFDVSIDWLCSGETAYIGAHLAKRNPGIVAILPARGPHSRLHDHTLAAVGMQPWGS